MWKRLFAAAADGDAEAVHAMLASSSGVVDLANPKTGDTVMHVLCRGRGPKRLKLLQAVLDESSSSMVSSGNYDGKTMLHEAAQFKNAGAVRLLLSRGAAVDALKRADWTPLMLAATKANNEEVVSALIEAGADPTRRNKDGWTPFHLAARAAEDSMRVLELLLEADPTIWSTKSHNSRTPLHTVALNGRQKALDFLMSRMPRNSILESRDSCGSTPLMEAVRGGSLKMVEVILPHLALEDADELKLYLEGERDTMGRNVLHIAAHSNHFEIVAFFLTAHRMDPFARSASSDAMTALHWAALEGQAAAARELICKEPTLVAVKDGKGRTAEDIAAAGNFIETANLLRADSGGGGRD